MTREQLEAVIWRHWPPIAGAGPTQAVHVDAILTAADAYAQHTGGITAERRAVLARLRDDAAARGIRAEPPGGPLPEPVGAGRDIEDE